MNLKATTLGILMACAALGTAAYISSTPAVQAKDNNVANLTKEQVEQIVHDYLLNHPEVILEVNEKIELLKEKLAKEKQEQAIKNLYADKTLPQSGPGTDKAKHFIVEFFDYNCGYCKKARPIFEGIIKKDPTIQYYYLELPILSEISYNAAQVGIAIYQMSPAKYVEYNQTLMTSNTRLQNEIELQVVVEKLGLNWSEVKAKSESMDVQLTLKKIREISQGFEVTGTPAFIIDGEILRGAPRNENMVLNLFKN